MIRQNEINSYDASYNITINPENFLYCDAQPAPGEVEGVRVLSSHQQ